MKDQHTTLSWSSLFVLAALAAYLFVFMEWLFTITKPSFMSHLTFWQQFQIFLFVSALLAGFCLVLLLPLALLSLVPRLRHFRDTLIKLGGLLPAGIAAMMILLLVDNFTYTLFKFGIVSTAGLSRALYGLGTLLAIVLCYRSILNTLGSLSQRTRAWGWSPGWIFAVLIGVLVLSLTVPAINNESGGATSQIAGAGGAVQRPHIILITSDGVNATNMSLYGYERDTTPELRKLAESALVAENAFTNSRTTAGSVISIYTGKYPAKTRLLYPPDILKGSDAYQHLPGILRSLGYKTVQITLPHFLDAYELNLLEGFDEANGRTEVQSKFMAAINQYLPNDFAYFTYEIGNRVIDRVLHIAFIKQMTDVYSMVTDRPESYVDAERLENLSNAIRSADEPVFVHVHLMGTHGDKFNPTVQKFSEGQPLQEQEPWSVDFYDDSILEFDKEIGAVVDELTGLGLLDRSILVVGSDHGQRWDQKKRIPLIIRFPHGQHAGRIRANVQNLDITPTILDYMGLNQPDWMSGSSLIGEKLEQRPIFSVGAQGAELDQNGEWNVIWENVSAPFYQFGGISVINCQKWYELDLASMIWWSGEVEGSTAACLPGSEITDEQAFEWMVAHLKVNGFDVSSLDRIPPSQSE